MEVKSGSIVSLKASTFDVDKIEQKNEDDDIIKPAFPVWSSRVKHVLVYICGITNFPGIILLCTAAGEFGATTLIPHLLSRICVGTPIALIEILLGRFITGNVSRIAKMCPFNRGVFFCLIMNTMLLIMWNNVFIIYALKYLLSIFPGTLPWTKCDKSWADIGCYQAGSNATAFMECVGKYSESYCRNLSWESSENQYWRRVIGNPFHHPVYNLLYLLTVMVIVVLINCKGIRSLEKLLILFVVGTISLCIIFVVGSFHSPGEVKGLMNVWYFDTSLLSKPRIWIISFENCLLSIGLGGLSLSFISSHGKIFDDIFLDVFVAILTEIFYFVILAVPISGIIWFTMIRSENKNKYPLFKDHLDTFISISAALAEYPKPVLFWTGIFYTQMIWLSLGNQCILMMALGDAIYGIFDLEHVFSHYFYFVCILGIVMSILSVPILFIPFNDMYPFTPSILMTIFLFSFTLIVFYGIQKFKSDFHFLMGYPAPMYFRFFWVASIPILCIFMVLKMVFRIPNKPLPYIVFIYMGVPLTIYLFGVMIEICKAHQKKNVRSAFMANPNWGPDDPLLKKSRIILDSVSATKEFLYRQELYTKLFLKPFEYTEQNIVQVI